MSKELEAIKKERDRLITFEREVKKRREEGEELGSVGKPGLIKEIAKVRLFFGFDTIDRLALAHEFIIMGSSPVEES